MVTSSFLLSCPLTSVNLSLSLSGAVILLTSCWLLSFTTAANQVHSVLAFGFLKGHYTKYPPYQNSRRQERFSPSDILTYSGCGCTEGLPEFQHLCMHRRAWKWMIYCFLVIDQSITFSITMGPLNAPESNTKYIHKHFSLVNPACISLIMSEESPNDNFKSYSHKSLLNSELHLCKAHAY